MIYKNLLSRQTTRFDGRGDYQAPDHMHTRTKLSYVCARAKSLEHSLPLKLICYGKEGSERIESWHLAGSNLFLSFWEIFFLFTFTIGRWTKALHVEEIFESVQKITHKYATSN